MPLLALLAKEIDNIILAATIRNTDTFQYLLDLCLKNHLRVDEEIFDISSLKYFPYLCILDSLKFKILNFSFIK